MKDLISEYEVRGLEVVRRGFRGLYYGSDKILFG